MSILISGSLAYDHIMDFPDSFKNHILPDQTHILNVSFVVETLKKEFGGCAGNIAYTMKLLGGEPAILSPLGKDGKEYRAHCEAQKITTAYMPLSKKYMTASAFITTDKDDNQICAFHPGAMVEAHELSVNTVKRPIELAIIAPTQKDAMIRHAKECAEDDIPIVLDPGQQLTALSPQELMLLIGQASFLIANDYEMKLIEQKTGWREKDLLEHVDVLITTFGERGSTIKTKKETIEIKSCAPQSVDDPTGAGDAYRAGFFTAYFNGHDLKTCGQVASVAATYAVEQYGTQNHTFTKKEFAKRYEAVYGEALMFH